MKTQKRETTMIQWNGKKLLAFLFPPKCVGCGELMPADEGAEIFCPFCRTSWEVGRLSDRERYQLCDGPILGRLSLVRYRSGETEGVPQRMIYHMKHHDERRVFDFVAREMIPLICMARVDASIREDQILLSYPPRSRRALRKDGFDQAKRMAQAVSRGTGFPVAALLERTGHRGKEQKRLTSRERQENATAAYRLSEVTDVRGKVIFLFDDVYTTGATLRACADLLVDAGAEGVFLATVGITTQRPDEGFSNDPHGKYEKNVKTS